MQMGSRDKGKDKDKDIRSYVEYAECERRRRPAMPRRRPGQLGCLFDISVGAHKLFSQPVVMTSLL